MANTFENQEALLAGMIGRKVGTEFHLLLADICRSLDLQNTQPTIQAGTVTLHHGESPFVPATMTANSVVVLEIRDWNGTDIAGNFAVAHDPDRILGLASAGGGFIAKAVDVKDNPVNTDEGIYSWVVVNPP